MIFKKRIHRKMMLYFLGVSLIVYVSSLIYVGYKVKDIAKNMAHADLEQSAIDLNNNIHSMLLSKAEIVESLASIMQDFNSMEETARRPFYTSMLEKVISDNKDIMSIWSIWAENSIDFLDEENILADDATKIGTYSPSFFRSNGEVKVEKNDGMPPYDILEYTLPQEKRQTILLDPKEYSYDDVKTDTISSVVAPIIVDGEFMGVVGIDFTLKYIQEAMSAFKKDDGELVYLIAADNKFVYNSKNEKLAGTEQDILTDSLSTMPSDTVFVKIDKNKHLALLAYKKLNIVDTQWHLISTLPIKIAYAQANKAFLNVIVLIVVGLIVLSIVISVVAKSISKSIVRINQQLSSLSLGIINKEDRDKQLVENEISELAASIDKLSDSLQASIDFADEIGRGNLDVQYNVLSEDDTLGDSLKNMQKSLIIAKEEEDKKKLLDEQRNWVTHGLANFGEIIRQENDNIENFAYNLLSQLLKYMDIVQGAIYFKVDNEYETELKFENKAAIAYGKQIMLDATVTEQDGLFGRVITEKKCIYLENIPNSYVDFTQGKKEVEKPRNLLVVPMLVNEDIFGIMEMVSYTKIENYKIEFVEKLCENIASVISSVNTNVHNAKLLEQSNEQAEELAQHEEEMRQNLEEMQATQEEATKRHEILNAQIDAFYRGLMVAIVDLNGQIVNMSRKMLNFYGINHDNVRGSSYIAVVAQDEAIREAYKDFWNNMLIDGKAKRKQDSLIRGKQLSTMEYYKVIYENDEPSTVMIVAINKTRENELNDRLMIELQSYMKENGLITEE